MYIYIFIYIYIYMNIGAIRNILDIVPLDIHDKCPVIIGCNRDVDMVLAYYK
jgi:fructose-1,6-bisphosphatase